jgi:hypothetical protein
MAESEQEQIIKMIEGLSETERLALIKGLQKQEGEEPQRTKVRRKHYKKAQQFQAEAKPKPKPKLEPKQQSNVRHRPKKERPNLFEESPLFEANKADSAVDKKLWANHQPTERSRTYKTINVKCSVCGTSQSVSPSLIFRSGSGPDETSRWTCNKCLPSKASH